MNRSEAKFQNTANKMTAALITLLETKSFTDISIMDICKEASVNRSTFYSHYTNTQELLKETQQSLIKNFMEESFSSASIDLKSIQTLSKDEINFITPKYLIPFLKYIQKHKRLFKIFSINSLEMIDLDSMMVENLFVPIFAKYGVTDKKLISYMQKYFLKGIHAIINEWVANDCEDDILFICEIITFCVRPTSIR